MKLGEIISKASSGNVEVFPFGGKSVQVVARKGTVTARVVQLDKASTETQTHVKSRPIKNKPLRSLLSQGEEIPPRP